MVVVRLQSYIRTVYGSMSDVISHNVFWYDERRVNSGKASSSSRQSILSSCLNTRTSQYRISRKSVEFDPSCLHADGQTDMTKLIFAVRNFVNASN